MADSDENGLLGFSLFHFFIVPIWCETVCFGMFFCMWIAAVYLYIKSQHENHGRIMLFVSSLMMLVATVHVAANLRGLEDGMMQERDIWTSILTLSTFMLQEFLGAGVNVYRLWMIWNRRWCVAVVPGLLLTATIALGCAVVIVLLGAGPASNLTDFSVHLARLISSLNVAFAACLFVLNLAVTILIAYRFWLIHKLAIAYLPKDHRSPTIGIIRIVVESAALQTVAECLLFTIYCRVKASLYFNTFDNMVNLTTIAMMPSLVGMTFCMIAIRIRLPLTESDKMIEHPQAAHSDPSPA